MELLGAVASGFTLAALFKYSFEALDLIQLYQTQDTDFSLLQLQYKLEKCRLYNWGDKMGLADHSKQNLLSEWHSKDLVSETLQEIINLFCDSQVIRKKYGCDDVVASSAPSLPAPECSHGIASAFDHFRIQSSNVDGRMSRLKKTKWVIRDRKKFVVLISDVRILINSLEKITKDLSSTARLEELLRTRINSITEIDTLLAIASVWKESHPHVASVASTRAESISMTSGKYEFVSQWQVAIDSEASCDTLIADVEDLTITELKHSVILSNEKVETLTLSLDAASQSVTHLQQKLFVLKSESAPVLHEVVFVSLFMTICFLIVEVFIEAIPIIPDWGQEYIHEIIAFHIEWCSFSATLDILNYYLELFMSSPSWGRILHEAEESLAGFIAFILADQWLSWLEWH